MYTLQPTEPKTASRRNTWLTFAAVMLIALAIMAGLTYLSPPLQPPQPKINIDTQKALAAQVELRAKPWNDGKVHVWSDLNDDPATRHTDVPESARCARLDDLTYTLGSGSTTIRYYKLACNGVVGYVERDQVR